MRLRDLEEWFCTLINDPCKSNDFKLLNDKNFDNILPIIDFGDTKSKERAAIHIESRASFDIRADGKTNTWLFNFNLLSTDYIEKDNVVRLEKSYEDDDSTVLEFDRLKRTISITHECFNNSFSVNFKLNRLDFKKLDKFFEQLSLYVTYAFSYYKCRVLTKGVEKGYIRVARFGDTVEFEGVTMQDEFVRAEVKASDWIEGNIWKNKDCYICLERGFERLNITVAGVKYYFPVVSVDANVVVADIIIATLFDAIDYSEITDIHNTNWRPSYRLNEKEVHKRDELKGVKSKHYHRKVDEDGTTCSNIIEFKKNRFTKD